MSAARTRRIALAVALAASAPLIALLLALGLAYGQPALIRSAFALAGLDAIAIWINRQIGRIEHETEDGRQIPLDPDPFETADSDGFAHRIENERR